MVYINTSTFQINRNVKLDTTYIMYYCHHDTKSLQKLLVCCQSKAPNFNLAGILNFNSLILVDQHGRTHTYWICCDTLLILKSDNSDLQQDLSNPQWVVTMVLKEKFVKAWQLSLSLQEESDWKRYHFDEPWLRTCTSPPPMPN